MNTGNNSDPFDLNRFITAQAPVYDTALAELKAGRKRSHWMWFVFPQIHGLGRSPTAKFYAIKSLDEASAYLNHPLLGPRLLECTAAVLGLEGLSAADIFGYPDDMKFRSSLTLFGYVAPDNPLFEQALNKYYEGQRDTRTLAIVSAD